MVANEQIPKSIWAKKLDEVFGLDLRSLAAFRIGIALVLLADLGIRFGDVVAHYTDAGVMPRSLLAQISKPWHWSLHAISGEPIFQVLLFTIAAVMAIAMLVGYHTRIATIASWVLLISLHNRNPSLIFAADDVLRALMFWAMFLPLGASYSIESALNSANHKLPARVVSGATVALIFQQCFIYIFSAAFKTRSPVWTEGTAVYYSLSFDQYATPIGHFLLNFPALLTLFTYVTLVLEWVAPLLLFVPVRNSFFRMCAVITFVMLHAGFGLTLNLGIFPFLSIFSWLAFLPSSFWHALHKRLQTPARQGLKIYFDADCGFCKKVVHLLRTLLILPGTPLLMAQEYPDIYADMQAYNSWVVEDWQGKRHFKFAGIVYIVSLSPVFFFLVPLLNWKPVMAAGTKFYEAVATNRKIAGRFTKPFKFRPIQVRPSRLLNILALLLLLYTFVWNVSSYAPDAFKRKVWQSTEFVGRATRLDQSWSIFAPGPPRDDGWYVIPGRLQNGSEVDIFRSGNPVSWDKPSLGLRGTIYNNMQWRTYFINLNRAIGQRLYPFYGQYLCRTWNAKHPGEQSLKSFDVYFMDERTVPPGEKQTVEKKQTWQQSCS
ncbi:HTTM domain-containing protein [Nostoc sp. TCL26-01]|uniref:HTTM domain-containing protein n=1 Tax=Nostoc sp. TCL26-01 TaxID=2576904 RepID=UPI0015BD575E|nr:HTTM domain-containing protein [Nostoc sp. TCL26-01]QLE56272.1 HTTM domain-containing protein [Nostoc sp. TCL26-01]